MSERFQNWGVDTNAQFFELACRTSFGAPPLSQLHVLRAFHIRLAFPQEVWSLVVEGGQAPLLAIVFS